MRLPTTPTPRPTPTASDRHGFANALIGAGTSAVLVVLIMSVGTLGLWVGAPLLWLWIGSQVQGATGSIGAAFGVGLTGAVITVSFLAVVLVRLSNGYRQSQTSRGLADPGHAILERVLVIGAAVVVVAFVAWFFLIAGASPLPINISL